MGAGAVKLGLCDFFGGGQAGGDETRCGWWVKPVTVKQQPCTLDLDSGSARSDLRKKRGGIEKVDISVGWREVEGRDDGVRSGKK
jgi:hypothetical protein